MNLIFETENLFFFKRNGVKFKGLSALIALMQ